jgi:hypothetical protein
MFYRSMHITLHYTQYHVVAAVDSALEDNHVCCATLLTCAQHCAIAAADLRIHTHICVIQRLESLLSTLKYLWIDTVLVVEHQVQCYSESSGMTSSALKLRSTTTQ